MSRYLSFIGATVVFMLMVWMDPWVFAESNQLIDKLNGALQRCPELFT